MGKIPIVSVDFATRSRLRETLYNIIRQEIIDHRNKKIDNLNTSKSLCAALVDYEIKHPASFIYNLFNDFGLEPELRTYRNNVLRSQEAKQQYDDKIGLAAIPKADREIFAKRAWDAGMGSLSEDESSRCHKPGGLETYRKGVGIFKYTKEERVRLSVAARWGSKDESSED